MMTEDEMRAGFRQHRELTQEEWSEPWEIATLDKLIAEGACTLTRPWGYSTNFQCSYRKVIGNG